MCSASLVMRNGGGERRGINSPGGVAGDAWRCPERMDASEPGTTTCFGSRNMDRRQGEVLVPGGELSSFLSLDLLEGKEKKEFCCSKIISLYSQGFRSCRP